MQGSVRAERTGLVLDLDLDPLLAMELGLSLLGKPGRTAKNDFTYLEHSSHCLHLSLTIFQALA